MSSVETPIAVGMVAPSFVLHDDARRPLSSSETRGRPWVLAFARGWTPGEGADAIRAQLRGLGAILFIVSDTGVWSFRPDDDIELTAGPSRRMRRELAELAARWGVPPGEDGVFVVDGHGVVQLANAPSGELSATLAGALAAAGRELLGLPPRPGITRRDWAVMSLVAGFGVVLLHGCRAPGADRPAAPAPVAVKAGSDVDVVLRINGQDRRLRIDPRTSLLDVLREHLALTGARKGCDHGQCGACTVHVNGVSVNSCLSLAVMHDGDDITTIEGLERNGRLHPIQQAFWDHDAYQCGYCTSGQMMSAVVVLHDTHIPSDDHALREAMSGNICRCGAYKNIVAAIQDARGKLGRAG